MDAATELACACGQVRMRVRGRVIMHVECCCTTCRDAGRRFEQLPGAAPVLTDLGTTPYAMYRKDRVDVLEGRAALREHRLEPDAPTRRVIAVCCNTPMFLEFQRGHWLSVYTHLWPEAERPAPVMRTMARSIEEGVTLPDDIPNVRTHSPRFMVRLLAAWAAMGFRAPKLQVDGAIDA